MVGIAGQGVAALLFALICLQAAQGAAAATNVTLSGISSGGAFAVQFHVAYSSIVSGVGIVAGVPYYCAQGTILGATTCMSTPSAIVVSLLVADTKYAYAMNSIDSPALLANSRVYLYSGTKDSVVNPGTMQKLLTYYQNFISSSNFKTVFNIPSEHAFITNNYGSACAYVGIPFINNCQYDQAGDILGFLYGTLNPPVNPNPANVIQLGQTQFIPGGIGPDVAALGSSAYLYVPSRCTKGSGCRVHVAFHGCLQTLADINTSFVINAGYNRWAEANNIVILYPQAKKTLVNPNGCWDWWGYTGAGYASQLGVQIATMKNMIDSVTKMY